MKTSKINQAIMLLALGATGCKSTSLLKESGKDTGGGHLLSEFDNPWFIQNTKTVRYCNKIDSENFGVSLDMVRSNQKKAFKYWQKQFQIQNENPPLGVKYPAVLGTQRFIEVPCDQVHEITFLLGVLPKVAKIERPQTVIGQTVMTSYDRKNLKGSGFIYLAPEKGSLALATKAKNFWSFRNSGFLLMTLIHEMSHVYGSKHGNLDIPILEESHLRTTLGLIYNEQKDPNSANSSMMHVSDVFYPASSNVRFFSCLPRKAYYDPGSRKYLPCAAVTYRFSKAHSSNDMFDVLLADGPGEKWRSIGKVTGIDFAASEGRGSWAQMVLPSEQTVLDVSKLDDWDDEAKESVTVGQSVQMVLYRGASFKAITADQFTPGANHAVFVSNSGLKAPVKINLTEGQLAIEFGLDTDRSGGNDVMFYFGSHKWESLK